MGASAKQRGSREVISKRRVREGTGEIPRKALAPCLRCEVPRGGVQEGKELTLSEGTERDAFSARRMGEGPVRPYQHPMHPHPNARAAGSSARVEY